MKLTTMQMLFIRACKGRRDNNVINVYRKFYVKFDNNQLDHYKLVISGILLHEIILPLNLLKVYHYEELLFERLNEKSWYNQIVPCTTYNDRLLNYLINVIRLSSIDQFGSDMRWFAWSKKA